MTEDADEAELAADGMTDADTEAGRDMAVLSD